MRRRSTFIAAVAAALMATGAASGTAMADQGSSPATWCGSGWAFSMQWGASAGQPCWVPSHVKGWVEDRWKDHHCVVMRFDWYRNGYHVDSKLTAPVCDGDSRKQFNLKSADPYANWVNWQIQYV
ncbi:uncharacterized protein (DUF1800 family) [Streptomyces sp. V4I8]